MRNRTAWHARDTGPLDLMIRFWLLPYSLSLAWMENCLSATARDDQCERNPRGNAQLPVPANIQDSTDRDLFA